MIGELLQQRYQIIDFLGKGGQGHTYLAIDKHRPGNPKCVVKHLKPYFNDPRFLETAKRLFQSEAEILAKLANYAQIPQLFAYFEQNKEFFLVEEFIDGQDLSKEICAGKIRDERYVINLLKGILPILEVLHQKGVIHRDIKPPNIIRRNSDKQLVLIDFGAVKQFQNDLTCGANLSIDIGSPGYTPSEQLRGRPKPSSDLYALGMMCIQALTGVHPRHLEEDESEEVCWQHLTSANPILKEILSKMVRHNTKERYKSATEVLIALERFNYQPRSSTPAHQHNLNPKRDSDSTFISSSPSQHVASSSPEQPFDPWYTSSGTNAKANPPTSRPSQAQVNPPVPPRPTGVGSNPPTSRPSQAQVNPPVPPRPTGVGSNPPASRPSQAQVNPPSVPEFDPHADTEVFASNASSSQRTPNPPVSPPTPDYRVDTIFDDRTVKQLQSSPSGADTEVLTSQSNSRLNQPVAPQTPNGSGNTTFVDGKTHSPRSPQSGANTEVFASSSTSRLNPPEKPTVSPAKTTIANSRYINPNIPARQQTPRHSNYHPQSRPNYPQSRPRGNRNNNKIFPIAIVLSVAALAAVGFFGVIQPTFLTKDSNLDVIADLAKNDPAKSSTTQEQKTNASASKPKTATEKQPTATSTTKNTDTKKYDDTALLPGLTPDNPVDSEQAEANKLLAKADKLAAGGKFKDAITEANKVSVQTGDSYLKAQEKIDKWSSSIVQKAIEKYQKQGKLTEAIAMLKTIPAGVSQAESARELSKQWNQEWADNQKYAREAQRAIIQSRWQDASFAADSLSDTNPYWQSRKTKLQKEIAFKQAAAEKKQQQLAQERSQPSEQPQPQPQVIANQQPQPQPQPKIVEQPPQQTQPPQIARRDAAVSNPVTPSNNNAQTDACIDGYVWREATPGDRICVKPEVRQQVAFDNAQAEDRRNAAAYDPESCIDGYVWRETTPEDRVCVTPRVRQQVIQDNAQAQARMAK
jgi:serine/threonine-protein kinase